MFDIPELDELVCRRLSTNDLAQCARVSKKWHTNSTPYLWQDLTYPRMKTEVLCELILDDYLYEQQYQVVLEGENNTEQHSSAPSTPSLPSLTKYGMYVRWLPDPTDLPRELCAIVEQQALRGHSTEAIAYDLIHHLIKRCPAFRVREFALPHRYYQFSGPQMAIVEKVLPRVQELLMCCLLPNKNTNFQKFRDLMDQCSGALERLNVNAGLIYSASETMSGTFELEEDGPSISWTSLKELNVMYTRSTPDPTFFWTWLSKRCRYVKRMIVGEIHGSIQSVAKCMREHMPHLDEIWMTTASANMKEDEIAALLTASCKGWRVVEIYRPSLIGESTMKALLEHSSTLEILRTESNRSVTSNDVMRILASCPNLRALSDDPDGFMAEDSYHIHANVFIDRDQNTGVLKTWACEASLQELKIKVTDIPRPDVLGFEAVQETYPGQGREMQGQVYDRLARLTSLETLWLKGRKRYSGCLEMSLASGLHRLSGLKRLQELDVSRTKARIGVQEVQWMTEHWPRLRVIGGLCTKENKEAMAWLRVNRPEIKLIRCEW
ncbi:MAG: hypothetical protein J3Q66DRAFT_350783 [Benniella sp.]|nr:MAG: hypothetical protein J3Q66DRAFT_350783 [Benniella sp.]